MTRQQNPNLEVLLLAVEMLGSLADEMVFLGGCATGLLITDPAAPPVRETRDVDAIVQLGSLVSYHALAERLRQRGFCEDSSEDAPICRWTAAGVILDVMPTDPTILGFGNPWYAEAMRHADLYALPTGKQIRVVTAPYFLVTKLAAFAGRGKGDYQMSHDLEDLVAVVDGRPAIVREINEAATELVDELRQQFAALLQQPRFVDAVAGHLPTDAASQARLPALLEKLKTVARYADKRCQ